MRFAQQLLANANAVVFSILLAASTVAGCASRDPIVPMPMKAAPSAGGIGDIHPAQAFACTALEYSQSTHNYPGDAAGVGPEHWGNGYIGILTFSVTNNPMPHSSAYFTPNPAGTRNQNTNFFKLTIGPSTPPGDYQITTKVTVTATSKPTNYGPQYYCFVVATPPAVSIPSVTVGNAPMIKVVASPTATNGKFSIYLDGVAVNATPRPTDEPIISNNSPPLYQSTTFEPGGTRIFQFTFLSSPLPSTQPTPPIAPGRYTDVRAYWDNYGSFSDPKVSTTSTPLPCYNLSNDVINQSLQGNAASMSLAVDLQAQSSPVKPIVVYSNTPDPRFPGVDSLAYIQGNQYPTDALLYLFYGPIGSQSREDQVIFHELDHFYYSGPTNGVFRAQYCTGAIACAAMVTLTLGGKQTKFLWNFIPIKATASNGYGDFIHLLIHDDIVNGFKSADQTGALAEAFDQVIPAPSPAGVYPTPNSTQWGEIQSLYTSATITWSWATPTPSATFTPSPLPSPTPTTVPPPPMNLTCTTLPHFVTSRAQVDNAHLVKVIDRGDPIRWKR